MSIADGNPSLFKSIRCSRYGNACFGEAPFRLILGVWGSIRSMKATASSFDMKSSTRKGGKPSMFRRVVTAHTVSLPFEA